MASTAKGKIVIISSPSGGGKSSICRQLLERHDGAGWGFSISYTTRARRPDERDGREYYFVTDDEFARLADQHFFAEECRVHLYRYGTPRKPLEAVLDNGGVMLLDIDVQGAKKIKAEYPMAATIFILPPSVAALRERLTARGTETQEQLDVRFRNAAEEMKLWKQFEYAVVNDDLNVAVQEVEAIIESHHCRTDRISSEQIENIIGYDEA